MPKWKFNMFHRGLLERPPGMIYGDFVDEYREFGGHKVKPFELPIEWPRFVGIDPGAVNTAMIWLAHDTERSIYYLYRESLEGGKSTPEHAKGASALAEQHHERVISWHVGQKAEEQQRMDWRAAGVSNVFEPPIHEVEAGIDRVIQLWKQYRLYVFDWCTGILDEIGRYARKLDKQGNTTDEIKDKKNFHRIDALRYVAVGQMYDSGTRIGFASHEKQRPEINNDQERAEADEISFQRATQGIYNRWLGNDED